MEECEKCLKCSGSIKQGDMFCSACGSEITSAKSEKAPAIENLHERELIKKYTKAINNGRWAILIIVILCVIVTFGAATLINVTLSGEQIDAPMRMFILIFVAVLIIAIFVALWLWAKTKPFPAMLIASCIYSIPIALNFIELVIRPDMAWAIAIHIFINITLISVLLKGVTSAYKHKKLTVMRRGVQNE